MIYVFDTSSLIVIGHYYPQQFPTFWKQFNQAVEIGDIISVREVFKELDREAIIPHLLDWVEHHRDIFITPNTAVTQFVGAIFAIPHFQTLVSQRKQSTGGLCADPFIIGLAKTITKTINGCVVTEEKKKPNAAKIPNVCQHFEVDCTNFQGFMERENWSF